MKDINNKEMFPIQQSYSKEEQIKRYWKCNYTTVESQLAYWILLPKDVKPVQIEKQPIEGLDINNIGQYVSIDKTCPMLEVSVYYEHCWYEMNSADWLAKKLHLMGENILHYRKINGTSTGTYADILTTKIINNDKSIISRDLCKTFIYRKNLAYMTKISIYLCLEAYSNVYIGIIDAVKRLLSSIFVSNFLLFESIEHNYPWRSI